MIKYIYLAVMTIFLFSCTKKVYQIKTEASSYQMNTKESTLLDSAVIKMIEPYKNELDAEMNAVIGYCPKEMTKAQPESTIGNWMADLIQVKSKDYFGESIDLAAQNYGSIRIPSLPKGDITVGKIYELMPFENRMILLYIKGDVLQVFFDRMALAGGWPISKSVSYKINNDKATDIYIQGVILNENKEYKLALPDYIANGGDNCDFFKGIKRKESPKLVRDAIFEYIDSNSQIESSISDRVVIQND